MCRFPSLHQASRSAQVLPVDSHRIPTGELKPVAGSAFDFTQPRTIGKAIQEVDGPGWKAGYDHCFVLHGLGDASPADQPLEVQRALRGRSAEVRARSHEIVARLLPHVARSMSSS